MDFLERLSGLLGTALLPEEVREPLSLASDHLVRGDWSAAETEALRVLQRRKDVARAYLILGLARRGLGDNDGARAALREALRRGPGDASAHLALAECELALGDAARALLEATHARDAGAPVAETAMLQARAHLTRGEGAQARSVLEALPDAERSAEALALLGDLLLDAGNAAGARDVLRAALTRGAPRPGLLASMARALLAGGAPGEALPHALRALSEAPANPDLSVLVAKIHSAAGNGEGALLAFERALELAPDHLEALRGAARAALDCEDPSRALALFDRAEALAPADAEAVAGRERALRLWRWQEERREREDAVATEAEAALRPDEVYALLVRVQQLFAATAALHDLLPQAGVLRDGYDRPLLLAIAGEFNAGKSTLLNALLGDAVAPMGVTPTTAAVNVFVYGTRQAARAILRDGTAAEVDLAEVATLVDARHGAGGGAVQFVEMIWPAEPLREVSLVDTPGFNAADEAHEAVARDFLGRADAVLWVFDATHAGSASERSAIEGLGPLRGKVVGVLNKADRLGEADREQVISFLRKSFAGEVAAWVACSSRDALEARRSGDAERLRASGFPELWHVLEERFFARARAAKRDATLARLKDLIGEARGLVEASRHAEAAAADFAAARRNAAGDLRRSLVQDLSGALEIAHRAGLRRVVSETIPDVLDIARRQPGGLGALLSPRIGEVDLRFLARVLGDRLYLHLDELGARAAAEVGLLGRQELQAWQAATGRAAEIAEPLLPLASRVLEDSRGDLLAGPFSTARAYARGWLDGGGLDASGATLAKADGPAAVERELLRVLPDELPWLEPFTAWVRAFSATWEQLALQVLRHTEATAAELEWRLLEPLARIERELAGLSGQPLR